MKQQHNARHIWSFYAKEGSDLFTNKIPQNTEKQHHINVALSVYITI
jgi:hypothetical protein